MEIEYITYNFVKIIYSIGKFRTYKPSEDSILLLETIKSYDKTFERALEVGCGSGFVIINLPLEEKVKRGVAIDIDDDAIFITKVNSFLNGVYKRLKVIKSNLLEGLKEKNFDLVFFNPPYLPKDEYLLDDKLDLWTIGGNKGNEKAKAFVEQAINLISENGKVLVLLSSLSDLEDFEKFLSLKGLKYKIVGRSI